MCSLLVSRDREQFVAVVVVVIIILVCAAAILCDRSIDVRGGLKSGVSLFFLLRSLPSAVCRQSASRQSVLLLYYSYLMVTAIHHLQ